MRLTQGEGVVYVKLADLIELVSDQGVTFPSEAVVLFGGFRMNEESELEIHFAWDSTDNTPSDWAVPPKFMLKEKS